jgi:hypothetical protein
VQALSQLLAVGALVYNYVVINTEVLTITALGEAGENSSTRLQEVAITAITAKGKDVEITPTVGKWFWNPHYIWRLEHDDRQPARVTRSVSFEIPVGTERSVSFVRDVWRGKAAVMVERGEPGEEPQIVDRTPTRAERKRSRRMIPYGH